MDHLSSPSATKVKIGPSSEIKKFDLPAMVVQMALVLVVQLSGFTPACPS
jgi:hypothetical protein